MNIMFVSSLCEKDGRGYRGIHRRLRLRFPAWKTIPWAQGRHKPAKQITVWPAEGRMNKTQKGKSEERIAIANSERIAKPRGGLDFAGQLICPYGSIPPKCPGKRQAPISAATDFHFTWDFVGIEVVCDRIPLCLLRITPHVNSA